MASQNRSAGYCVHCQRGVTIIRNQGDGIFGRVRSAMAIKEDVWVCGKCGNSASRNFTPPVEAPPSTIEEATLELNEQHVVEENPTAPVASNIQPSHSDDTIATQPESFSVTAVPETMATLSPVVIKLEDDPNRPAISKSICTLCQFEMTYPKKLAGKDVDCPSCEAHFQLP